jgi:hypothetical protein
MLSDAAEEAKAKRGSLLLTTKPVARAAKSDMETESKVEAKPKKPKAKEPKTTTKKSTTSGKAK